MELTEDPAHTAPRGSAGHRGPRKSSFRINWFVTAGLHKLLSLRLPVMRVPCLQVCLVTVLSGMHS